MRLLVLTLAVISTQFLLTHEGSVSDPDPTNCLDSPKIPKCPPPKPTKCPTPKPTTKCPPPKTTTKCPPPKPTPKCDTPKPTTKCATPKPTTKCATPKPTTKCATPKPTTKCATPKPTTKCPPVCRVNEVFSLCGNTGCQNTCADPTFAQRSRCACIPGCVCIEGYLKNSKGICVAPEDCDTCKENEIFSKCDNHGCQNTCAEPDLITRCSYVAGCYPGCICKPGFLKNTDGVCVPENTCIKQCPNENESYSSCGTACPKTCDNKDEVIMCTLQCVEGCFCNDGYVRDANGRCILPTDCPQKCKGLNEIFKTCGTACPKTCENKDAQIKCTDQCVEGCFCKDGYVRDSSNNCILPEKCPKTCGVNEVFDKCPPCSPAENTCGNIFDGINASHPSPCKECCKCKPGFVRIGKSCVVKEMCCSDPNAELIKNPSPCPGGHCGQLDFAPCRMKSPAMGCQCKNGYVKKSETDPTCVCISECEIPICPSEDK